MTEWYTYPRFVGGPRAKKNAPSVPRDCQYLEVACLTEPPVYSSSPSIDHTTYLYSRHRAGFGPNRVLEFWADSSLRGEDAFEQLVTDMFSRLGVRKEHDNG